MSSKELRIINTSNPDSLKIRHVKEICFPIKIITFIETELYNQSN